MESLRKIKVLGEGAKYDVCASTSSSKKKLINSAIGNISSSGICHSFTPDGRCISLFKVLLTNYCEKDCAYCPNRAGRNIIRTSFQSNELAKIFMEFYERNYVEGLFLSSGVWHSTTYTMGEIIKVAEILRQQYRYAGYIHLKILPGASQAEIQAAVNLANRISLNMESPNANRLATLSKSKKFNEEILKGMENINSSVQQSPGVTHTTQYIVGAAGESDQEILSSAHQLYQDFGLKRAYFSAFQPVSNTPLASVLPTPLIRENRLYQSDFLMRLYDFALEKLVFDSKGNLDQEIDPKLSYALHHPELFPLEINKAPYKILLRIPGIGPRSAIKIIQIRRQHRFTNLIELKNLGLLLKRALPFITINGRFYGNQKLINKPESEYYKQLSLWGDNRDFMFTNT